jgi:putative flippase GtrA
VEIAVLHNFIWHERFTWRDRAPAGPSQIVFRLCRFHAANGLISVCGNTAVTYALVERLHAPAPLAAAAAIVCCMPLNFLFADRWVFATASSAVPAART